MNGYVATALGGVLLLLSGCVTLIEPSAVHASWAEQRWPGTTVEDLQAARELTLQTCTQCHGVRSPERYEPGRWEFAIHRMLEGEVVTIEDAVIAEIARYLDTAAALPNRRAVEAWEASRGAGEQAGE
jgi:mono/diheme cytochrome c family protein